MGRIALALGAMSALAFPAHAQTGSPYGSLSEGWLELSGFGGSAGQSGGEADVFAPIARGPASLVFVDVSGEGYDGGFEAGNLALGYRQMLANGWNVGGYVGADVLGTPQDKTFVQGAVGLELTSRFLDVRANGYIPDTSSRFLRAGTGTATATTTTGSAAPQLLLQGNQLLLQTAASTVTTTTTTTTSTLSELGYAGFDGEVGVHGPLAAILGGIDAELRLYAGGFYFHNDNGQEAMPGLRAAKTIAGPKARLELAFFDPLPGLAGSQLTFEAQYSYDDVRRDQGYAGVRLRIPFSFGPQPTYNVADDQERRLHDRLRRDHEILTQTRTVAATKTSTTTTTTGGTTEGVEDAATDVPIDRVVFANATTGITALAAANGADTLIVADGSKGTIMGGQTLQASQTLLGGGSTLLVQGVTTGTQATFTAPGTMPTIQEPTNPALTIASNNHVKGLNLTGTSGNGVLQVIGNDGIAGPGGLQNVVIENNMLSAFGDSGISLGDGNSGIKIINNSISNVQFLGMRLGDNNSNVIVSNNSFSNVGDTAVFFDDGNSNVTVSNNTLSNIIFKIPPNIGGAGGPFDTPNGIDFRDNNSNITISNNSLSNVGASGIEIGNMNTFSITGNALSNIGNNVSFPGSIDFPAPGGAGGPFAIAVGSTNTGTISGNTFTAPITTTVLGSFDPTRPAENDEGINNVVTGSGNVLAGSPKPTACGHFDAASNPGSDVQFTDGSHCP